MKAPVAQVEARTLGRDLELRRLEFQAHRLELVLRALHDRRDKASGERVPAGLEAAIRQFHTELRVVSSRRGELGVTASAADFYGVGSRPRPDAA
jgi:hypothetical protein